MGPNGFREWSWLRWPALRDSFFSLWGRIAGHAYTYISTKESCAIVLAERKGADDIRQKNAGKVGEIPRVQVKSVRGLNETLEKWGRWAQESVRQMVARGPFDPDSLWATPTTGKVRLSKKPCQVFPSPGILPIHLAALLPDPNLKFCTYGFESEVIFREFKLKRYWCKRRRYWTSLVLSETPQVVNAENFS